MGVEIERKFLVKRDVFEALEPSLDEWENMRQGYLSTEPAVRVRRIEWRSGSAYGTSGELTIKGPGSLVREEYEYPIPYEDATALLRFCPVLLDKTRYWTTVGHEPVGVLATEWVVDFFPDLDLYVAEVELPDANAEFAKPAWLDIEVTDDPYYANTNLAKVITEKRGAK